MAVRRVRKKLFPCRHKGFGQTCHRCEQADVLVKLVEQGKALVTNKNYPKDKPKPKTWTKKEMTEEAQRLRRV